MRPHLVAAPDTAPATETSPGLSAVLAWPTLDMAASESAHVI